MNGDVLQLTVSQFTDRLRGWIGKRPELANIAIVGEISDYKPHPNGNVYFNLKDDRALLACVVFSGQVKMLPPVENGNQVIATGKIDVWDRKSQIQLTVRNVAAIGIGAMAAKVEQLRRRLQAEGLFERARKRRFVAMPHRVALVSARGKGAADFELTLREKAPNVAVVFVETRVQGEGAEIDIAEAIDRAGRAGVDAIVVLRGGGSYEDRFPFNTEAVVRAIARSKHPVVTAIGHTGDHHLADEVADAVYKTPTAAAEHIAQTWWEATSRLGVLQSALVRDVESVIQRASRNRDFADSSLDASVERRLSSARQRFFELRSRLERASPAERLAHRATRLAGLEAGLRAWPSRALPAWANATRMRDERLGAQAKRLMPRFEERLSRASALLAASDPERPLERGYAIVLLRGKALRDAADVRPKDEIVAKLHRGSLSARVEAVVDNE